MGWNSKGGTARAEQQRWKTEGSSKGGRARNEREYEQGLRVLPRRAFPDPERQTMKTHVCSDGLFLRSLCYIAADILVLAPFACKLGWVSSNIF